MFKVGDRVCSTLCKDICGTVARTGNGRVWVRWDGYLADSLMKPDALKAVVPKITEEELDSPRKVMGASKHPITVTPEYQPQSTPTMRRIKRIRPDSDELCREYLFPDNQQIQVFGVKEILIRDSGSHEVILSAPKTKYIISPGWLAIRIVRRVGNR